MNIKRLGAVLAAAVISVSVVTVTALAAGTRVPINEKYFPDENFREYVKQFDTDGNGSLSQKERDAVTEINVGLPNDDEIIKSLVGVGYFQNLEKLDCSGNELTKLNVSQNTKLTNLYCNTNNLKKLDLKNNTELVEVFCFENKIESLDVSGCTKLSSLNCRANKLTVLDISSCENVNAIYDSGVELKD